MPMHDWTRVDTGSTTISGEWLSPLRKALRIYCRRDTTHCWNEWLDMGDGLRFTLRVR